jgi:hypothetical protein
MCSWESIGEARVALEAATVVSRNRLEAFGRSVVGAVVVLDSVPGFCSENSFRSEPSTCQ